MHIPLLSFVVTLIIARKNKDSISKNIFCKTMEPVVIKETF